MWLLSILIAQAEVGNGDVLPWAIGGGTGGLSAVLLYLLREERKERKDDAARFHAFIERSLPIHAANTEVLDRVLIALSEQLDYQDRLPSDRAALEKAYTQLRAVLDELPSPRRRGRA